MRFATFRRRARLLRDYGENASRLHEAIETVRTEDQPEGVVVEEVRKGYRIGDETLRPARVKVSAGPG